MGNLKYYVLQGEFVEKDNCIEFLGKRENYVDKETNETKYNVSMGRILLSDIFKEGEFSYEITLKEIDLDTRFGIFLDYKKIDTKQQYVDCTVSNDNFGYSLDVWDGSKWDFKIFGGSGNTLKNNTTYLLKVKKYGSNIKFYVNDMLLYTYTNMSEFTGSCGIYVVNAYEATITNVNIIKTKPKVFAVMKFQKDFDDLYKEVIVPQFNKYGYDVIRADECYTATSILQDIIQEISAASIIIADITMDNPNVFYEVGYAHALKKTTILLADKDKRDKLPFDISGFRTIFYSNSIGGKSEIENTLTKYIENINRENL